MGLAAYAYGSPSVPVEAFVQSFLDPFRGLFAITNTECILVVNADSDDDDQIITIRPWPPQQFNLYRLGRIIVTIKKVLQGEMSQLQALDELDALEQEKSLFGRVALFLSYICIGAGLVWWRYSEGIDGISELC